jgi:hypothetical protein
VRLETGSKEISSPKFAFAVLVEQAQLDFGGVGGERAKFVPSPSHVARKDADDPLEPHFFSFPSRTYFSGRDIPGSKNFCTSANNLASLFFSFLIPIP